jgi:hypothetical protein
MSVAAMDHTTVALAVGDSVAPVEARLLILSANGSEPELQAIRALLDFRGVPYDVFVATAEAPLSATRLQSGARGLYQATILTSSSLAISGTSALSAAEWAVLANYEAAFKVRRAVLAAWPDPALGFGTATQQNTSSTPLTVDCTSAGQAVFRDVNCDADQVINGDVAYLSFPASGAPLTSLLADSAGHALAAVHQGSDGRESLLLLFRQDPNRLHSLLFLHGVLGWVTGGTYLGERRIDMGAQVDDLFIGAHVPDGSIFRLDDGDLQAALAWVKQRRSKASTPNFHLSFAFNGIGAGSGDPLTQEATAQNGEWYWINHTWAHAGLDTTTYSETYQALSLNVQLARDLPLVGFDVRDLVTPSVSGLVNSEAMRAASDIGIRYAVTDTSRVGCDNPTPNTTFYDAVAPTILLVPRQATNMFYNMSTPAEWVASYNQKYRDFWGRDFTYPELLDHESDVLLHYLMRGEADPWMFHQANLRAYDGTHSILGDLLDTTLVKLEARLQVPVGTPAMNKTGERFARRLNYDTAGVRATLFRGQALIIDAARSVSVPVTGVRAANGQSYGGDVIGLFDVVPGTSKCVPLDSAGLGCSPAPVRDGGAGTASALPLGCCDASDLPHPPVDCTVPVPPPPPPPIEKGGVPRNASWWYWDNGGDQGTAWRTQSSGGTGWDYGLGPLGYGESYLATTISYGPSATSKYITSYFTKSFSIDDPQVVSAMIGEVMFDDGFVVYLNGVEIGRAAMPAGTITASTLATSTEANNVYTSFDWSASKNLLLAGVNTIAVEVHQTGPTSSDLVFDLGLVVSTSGPPPPPPPPPPIPNGGVPRNASWWYWDNGGDPGTAWRTQTSPGTGWDSGKGPLGYGETYLQTTVSYGPSATNKYITTYFNTSFTVDDPSVVSAMIGEVMFDDGFVAYLNGVEIGRAAMPAGTITASTLAASTEANNSYTSFDWSASKNLLVTGTNTLAVEVHQTGPTSSDLVFDLGLTLPISGPPPPPPPIPNGGVPRNASWWYWDNGGDPGTAWRTQTSPGTGWDSGKGPLGYGETYLQTTVSFGPSATNKYITTYFNTSFTVDDPSVVSSMIGEVMYDDGFVAYLNGIEIGRAAMPAGSITTSTIASSHEANNAYETFDWSAMRGALRAGTNVLAVEVHQAGASSSDLVLDLALRLEGGAPPPPPGTAEDIARGSVWRYWDGVAAPSTGDAWATPVFNDSAWASGPGPLGYGETYIRTPISYGPDPDNKIVTAYFRRWFTVDSPATVTALLAELIYDDGVVIHLNGHEITRANMPSGTIEHTTLATTGYETGNQYDPFDLSAYDVYLVPGANLLAVEVHQAWFTSSDLTFDLALDVTP